MISEFKMNSEGTADSPHNERMNNNEKKRNERTATTTKNERKK